MNGIEKITARIEADAMAEIEAMRAENAEKCRSIEEQYAQTAKDEYMKCIKSGVKDYEDELQRMERAGEMDAKKNMLAMKQGLVSRAFDRAAELFGRMPDRAYTALLAKMAAEAAVSGREEIILNEKDRARLGTDVAAAANALLQKRGAPASLALGGETRGIAGGLILKDGSIETNCSLEELIASCRGELSGQVADILFGE